jgi:excinuclease UvrABC ATPase subunit
MIEQEIEDIFSTDILNLIYRKIHEIEYNDTRKAINKIKTHKICKTCKIEKLVQDFNFYKITLLRPDCKECRNKKLNDRYARGRARAMIRGMYHIRFVMPY